MIEIVKKHLAQTPQWKYAQRVVLAVSGGVDSMVLLHILLLINDTLPKQQQKEIFIAHFNHHLREDSDLDEDLVRQYAKAHDLTYFIGHWEEPATSDVEASAREARYQFLMNVVEKVDADTLMTGHHANDLAETMLMRLVRGTSLRGLGGIRSEYYRAINDGAHQRTVSVQILRPLISSTKEAIYQFAEEHGIEYREDYTNASDEYTRNRIRQGWMPELMALNPRFLENMQSLSDQLHASYRVHLKHYLMHEPEFLRISEEGYYILSVPRLREMDDAELEVYISIFFEERLRTILPKYHKNVIQQVIEMIKRHANANIQIDIANHWIAERSYDQIFIYNLTQQQYIDHRVQLDTLPINTWIEDLYNEVVGLFEPQYYNRLNSNPDVTIYDEITPEEFSQISLRKRQPGDVLELHQSDGTTFHKKIARIMIDEKIPRYQRTMYWMVVDQDNQIKTTIPPLAPSMHKKVSPDTKNYILAYKKKYTSS